MDGSEFAKWAAGSAVAYPLANVVHLFGLVLLVGGIGLLDLRLLGAFPRISLDALSDAVTPLAVGGLVLLALSGSVLFAADAVALAGSSVFHWKLVLIGLGLLNALAFRLMARRHAQRARRIAAIAFVSLLIWPSVLVLGRMIAYS